MKMFVFTLSGCFLMVLFGAQTVHIGAPHPVYGALQGSRTVLVPASADGGSEWG
jgi:hypothetical protein